MPGKNPAPGIRRTPYGWQAYVKVDGEQRSKRFPRDADLDEMLRWREREKRKSVWSNGQKETPPGTLGSDAARYLEAVAAMPSIADRTYHVQEWLRALAADSRTRDITPLDIRRALEGWRMQGLSHGSLNRRRTALMHLFNVVDPMGLNPVRNVPRYRETPPPLHLPTMADAAKVIARIGRKRSGRKARARLAVLMWTGLPPAQLMAIQPADIDWQGRTLLVRGRKKGKGTRNRRLPLLPKAVAALRRLVARNGLGVFNGKGLWECVQMACDKAGVARFRVYDLRHMYLTWIAQTVKDDRIVAELAMHTTTAQTRRYTEHSVAPRLSEAMAVMASALRKPRQTV
jgi:integrase